MTSFKGGASCAKKIGPAQRAGVGPTILLLQRIPQAAHDDECVDCRASQKSETNQTCYPFGDLRAGSERVLHETRTAPKRQRRASVSRVEMLRSLRPQHDTVKDF